MKMNFKKLFCLVLTLGLLLSMAACGSTPQDTTEDASLPVSEEPAKPSEPASDTGTIPSEPEPEA